MIELGAVNIPYYEEMARRIHCAMMVENIFRQLAFPKGTSPQLLKTRRRKWIVRCFTGRRDHGQPIHQTPRYPGCNNRQAANARGSIFPHCSSCTVFWWTKSPIFSSSCP
jgi:hypothetical protein